MATGVTGLLILFGLALLYAKQGNISSAFSQILALIILAQVLIVLAGYAYGVATYYYPFPFTDMSMYGALCGFLLALGLLAASPEYGIAAAIVEQSPAGDCSTMAGAIPDYGEAASSPSASRKPHSAPYIDMSVKGTGSSRWRRRRHSRRARSG